MMDERQHAQGARVEGVDQIAAAAGARGDREPQAADKIAADARGDHEPRAVGQIAVAEDARGGWEPKIVAFLCNWCSYAGADLAGTGRMQYPTNIRIVRLPCSGRVNPLYVLKALTEGADGVMVLGCHPGDCHYLTGNLYARRRLTMLKRLIEVAGIEPDRVQFSWVSASEGARFQQVVTEVCEKVKQLGPNRIARGGSESVGL